PDLALEVFRGVDELEASDPVAEVRDPVTFAVLSVVDRVDADVGLALDGGANPVPQRLLVRLLVDAFAQPVPDHELDELRRADQAAGVRGSYPVVAALHLAPLESHDLAAVLPEAAHRLK